MQVSQTGIKLFSVVTQTDKKRSREMAAWLVVLVDVVLGFCLGGAFEALCGHFRIP